MHRFFIAKDQIPIITGTDVHHIRNVLRLKTGDQLELLDGTGRIYETKISKIDKDEIICKILSSKQEESEPKIKVTLAQALPKGRKMDFVIEKCTELGVNQIIPMITERTVTKSAKIDRWKKIAKEAAEQSGRGIIPEIHPLTKFEEVLKLKNQFDLALIPWELEKEKTLKQILSKFPLTRCPNPQPPIPKSPNILLTIGPEGGFSQKEVELAKEAGFISISLGRRILRTETAGMAALSAIMYELE